MLIPNAPRRRSGGFTLIEMMITITVLGVLLVVGVPAMRSVLENGRIRTVGESWKQGLALARAEAVRRNAQVEFEVITDADADADVDGWQVRLVSTGAVLHEGSGVEGVEGVDVTILPVDATLVTYNPFGLVVAPNPDGSAPITQVDVESTNPPTNDDRYHPLRLQVLAGGMTRLCDPAVADEDSRACL